MIYLIYLRISTFNSRNMHILYGWLSKTNSSLMEHTHTRARPQTMQVWWVWTSHASNSLAIRSTLQVAWRAPLNQEALALKITGLTGLIRGMVTGMTIVCMWFMKQQHMNELLLYPLVLCYSLRTGSYGPFVVMMIYRSWKLRCSIAIC